MVITYIPMARGFVYVAAVVTGTTAAFWPGEHRSRSVSCSPASV
jgi:hypothetical protein